MNIEILNEINNIKSKYSSFRNKEDDFVLNAVVVKSVFYKNPSLNLQQSDLDDIVVDGTGDNGVDCILTDKNSEHNDMVFVQCKCYENITLDQVKAAISKMFSAYKMLKEGHFENFNQKTPTQYARCCDEMEEGAKIKFCFATSAPRSSMKTKSITNHFNSIKGDEDIYLDDEMIFFQDELVSSILDARSIMPCVEYDKILVDDPNNYLEYGDEEGIAVNISAYSLKLLYAKYRDVLLSQNLRYFVKNGPIDKDVDETIRNSPETFWFKNNGISIICDSFEQSGKEIHLKNFSVINGGQTTRKIFDSPNIDEANDFYLMCRIICNPYREDNSGQKEQFVYEISKATNSQKAIKPADLRANNREQKLFESALLSCNIFYKTKRGMSVPAAYSETYKNCDLSKVGKLALAGFFLMPGTSRNKPSIIFDDAKDFYRSIFNDDQNRSRNAKYISDLLYVDYYFDKIFIKQFKESIGGEESLNKFSGNTRTLVTAFVGFFAKYYNNEFTDEDLSYISSANTENIDTITKIQRILRKADNVERIFSNSTLNMDEKDKILSKIAKYAISTGFREYDAYVRNNNQDVVDETNWLKRDSSFYQILKCVLTDRRLGTWPEGIEELFLAKED